MISSNEVHIWRLLLNETICWAEALQKNLSIDEIERAARFYFETDRRRFIIARGALRTILGHYLGKKPNAIIFETTAFGKLMIADTLKQGNIDFNVSHSDELVLYAVTLNKKIGIDVERIRDLIDVLQIANKFFSPNEIAILENTLKTEQHKIFFQFWTRKEAFVKGLGEGLSLPLEQIDVSCIHDKCLSPVTSFGKYEENSRWHVQDLFPKEGYAAAIAVGDIESSISRWYNVHEIISPE
jgi:4'-phosphopantetheinyl transferase